MNFCTILKSPVRGTISLFKQRWQDIGGVDKIVLTCITFIIVTIFSVCILAFAIKAIDSFLLPTGFYSTYFSTSGCTLSLVSKIEYDITTLRLICISIYISGCILYFYTAISLNYILLKK
jgi:hypothetical protein